MIKIISKKKYNVINDSNKYLGIECEKMYYQNTQLLNTIENLKQERTILKSKVTRLENQLKKLKKTSNKEEK